MTHTVAALCGHADDTLIAWQQACVQAAAALQPPPDPERLAKALALAQDGAVRIEDDGDALVTSGDARYLVRANGTCLCPDAQHRSIPCKHTLAVHIHQQATAALAPGTSAAAPPAATPPAAEDTRQERLPSADRWAVTEAPARVLSQSCFFESLAVCKSLNSRHSIFGFCPRNRTLRQNLMEECRKT